MSTIKLFDRWSFDGVAVADPGLAAYVNIEPIIAPKTGGRHAKQMFYKSNLNIVERLINHMFVAGHKGKKHLFTSGQNVGKSNNAAAIVEEAFEIVEKKTKENPIAVFVKAIQNSAPIEEVISFQKGGIFAREGVVTSPQRRVDLALRHIAQGTYLSSTKKKTTAAECLAKELLLAFKGDQASRGVSEKTRREKEAKGAR